MRMLAQLKFRICQMLIGGEIHAIFEHLETSRDYGYPFKSDEELVVATNEHDIPKLLDLVEQQLTVGPRAYSDAIRYLLYRDIHERIKLYVHHLQLQIPHRLHVPQLAAQ